jgi:hypothetical protein
MKTTEKQARTYVKPAVLGNSRAKTTIQGSENKGPHYSDGLEATSPAYEADE